MSELDENEATGASLLEILEELTDRVQHAKSMPLSASVLVNQSEMLDLLETAQSIVPQQIVDADSVLQDASAVTNKARSSADSILADARNSADSIVADARREAEEIIAQAKAKAAQLVAKDAITITAQREAAAIADEAHQKANRIKQGADKYSDSTLEQLASGLGNVQDQIAAMQEQIAAGREVLAGRAEHGREARGDGGRLVYRKPRKGE